MQLGRYQVSTLRPPPILGVTFSHDGRMFAVATETGYEVWRTWPLGLLRRRALSGTLARAVPLPHSPLLVLQGGGSNPLFPPNKAVIYHDGRGAPVADLEFGERIRGIATRHRTVVIVLLRSIVAYEYAFAPASADTKGKTPARDAFALHKLGEWETAENENGLTAMSTTPGSSLLAMPGRQPGHVQLVHLPPCSSPENDASGTSPSAAGTTAYRSPILLAHTHPLSQLACSASGAHLVTASERGTLLRVWDTGRGALEAELRRGVDRAEIWGVSFEDGVFANLGALRDTEGRREMARRRGGRVVGWSDKGTVHVWGAEKADPKTRPPPSLTNVLSKALSLPNYFSSTASFAQYYLPRKNPHAFSSAIGAAADKAGLPSMKMRDDGEPEEREWAEHYVVSWIEVDVDDDEPSPSPGLDDGAEHVVKFRPGSGTGAGPSARRPNITVGTGGLTMGSREERRSFDSDTPTAGSTRTATPTRRGASTPTQASVADALRRRGSGGSSCTAQAGYSGVSGRSSRNSGTGSGAAIRTRKSSTATVKPKTTHKERQLVVVTHAGDWYRLRLPREVVEEGEAAKKTELVEYRRLGVGGSGW